jgi:ankyrin repeat protein
LMAAEYDSNIDIFEALLKNGGNINHIQSRSRWNILHIYSRHSMNALKLEYLLEKCPHLINERELEGGTLPLFCACASDPKPAPFIETFLRHGANPNIGDKDNSTPLMMAINYSVTCEVLKILIKYGANIDAVNDDGQRAIDYIPKELDNTPQGSEYKQLLLTNSD